MDAAPLDDVLVLEFAQLVPGPYAALILSHLGATVVKVEPPTGDPTRAMPPFIEDSAGGAGALFCALNRGKRSIQLDLKQDDDADAYRTLAHDASIVIDGYGAGVADRLGVGYDALSEDTDALTYVDITGFGPDGPLAQEPGHDLTYQAWRGTLADADPRTPNLPTADATGALWAALLALAHHHAPGTHRVDASLAGSLDAASLLADATHLGGLDADPLHEAPGYGVYECANGKPLALGALEPAFWRNLARALGDPELADEANPLLPDDPDALRDRIQKRLRMHPREAWLTRLREARVPCAPVRTTRESLDKPLEIASDDPPGARTEQDLLGAPALGEANDAYP